LSHNTTSGIKLRVFIFTSVHFWNDTRIFQKQAKSLAKYFQVELHAPAEFVYKEIDAIKVFGLPRWSKEVERKKIRKIIWQRIRNSNADVYHFHDPELLFIALFAQVFFKKPMIYDVHEHYPKMILDKQWIPKILRYPISIFVDGLERVIPFFLSGVIYATSLIGERFRKKNSICIANYPLLFKSNYGVLKKKHQIIYVGGITIVRGILELIKAFKIVTEKFHSIQLFMVGKYYHKSFKKEVTQLIRKLNLESQVRYFDHMLYDQLLPLIIESKIGMVTYLPYANNMIGLPNKLFEYMSCGTAVIASNFRLYKEIINDSGCGLLVDPTKPDKIAERIIYMLHNDIYIKYGLNGKNAVMHKYNWDSQEEKLIHFYTKIFNVKV